METILPGRFFMECNEHHATRLGIQLDRLYRIPLMIGVQPLYIPGREDYPVITRYAEAIENYRGVCFDFDRYDEKVLRLTNDYDHRYNVMAYEVRQMMHELYAGNKYLNSLFEDISRSENTELRHSARLLAGYQYKLARYGTVLNTVGLNMYVSPNSLVIFDGQLEVGGVRPLDEVKEILERFWRYPKKAIMTPEEVSLCAVVMNSILFSNALSVALDMRCFWRDDLRAYCRIPLAGRKRLIEQIREVLLRLKCNGAHKLKVAAEVVPEMGYH
jgi:hypothetical protein